MALTGHLVPIVTVRVCYQIDALLIEPPFASGGGVLTAYEPPTCGYRNRYDSYYADECKKYEKRNNPNICLDFVFPYCFVDGAKAQRSTQSFPIKDLMCHHQ